MELIHKSLNNAQKESKAYNFLIKVRQKIEKRKIGVEEDMIDDEFEDIIFENMLAPYITEETPILVQHRCHQVLRVDRQRGSIPRSNSRFGSRIGEQIPRHWWKDKAVIQKALRVCDRSISMSKHRFSINRMPAIIRNKSVKRGNVLSQRN